MRQGVHCTLYGRERPPTPILGLIQGQAQASRLTLTSQRSSANPAKAKHLEEYPSFSGVLANLLSQSISE